MRNFYFLFIFLCISAYSFGQITISTPISITPTDTISGGVIFRVVNGFSNTIRISEVSSYHAYNSSQSATIKLWMKKGQYNTPITTVNGWQMVKSKVLTSTTTNLSTLINNFSIELLPRDTAYLFLESNKNLMTYFLPSPYNTSSIVNSVELATGSPFGKAGIIPNPNIFPRCFVGNIKIDTLQQCNGIPEIVDIDGNSKFCMNDNNALTILSTSFKSGMSYNWYTSTSATGPWTFLTNTLVGTTNKVMTENTYFKVISICTNTLDSSSSNIFYSSQNEPTNCICSPVIPQVVDDEEIFNVKINDTNNISNCENLPLEASQNSIKGKYTDMRAKVNKTKLEVGSYNKLELDLNTCGVDNLIRGYTVYIDYNANTIFESNEVVTHAKILANKNFDIVKTFFTVPTTAGGAEILNKDVEVAMRIMYYRSNINTPYQPCGNGIFTFGEVEDYTLILTKLKDCQIDGFNAGVISGNNAYCANKNSNFVNYNYSSDPLLTRTWEYSFDTTTPAVWTQDAITLNNFAKMFTQKTIYVRSKLTCNGVSKYSNIIRDTLNPAYYCICEPFSGVYYVTNTNNVVVQNYIDYVKLVGSNGSTVIDENTSMSISPYLRYRNTINLLPEIELNPFDTLRVFLVLNQTTTANKNVKIFFDSDSSGLKGVSTSSPVFTNCSEDLANPSELKFTIPNNQPNGKYLLRVKHEKATTVGPPCNQTNNQGEIHDYLINVKLHNEDLVVVSIDSPMTSCNFGLKNISFTLKNQGRINIAPNMSYSINDGNVQTQTFDTINIQSTKSYSFTAPYDFSNIYGKIKIKLWNNSLTDNNTLNDTLTYYVDNYTFPPKPLIENDTVCNDEQRSIIYAKSSSGFKSIWYKNSNATNALFTADSLIFNAPFTNDTTFYVKSFKEGNDVVGLPSTSIVTNDISASKGLNFICHKRIFLKSVVLKATQAGNFTVRVINNNGNIVVYNKVYIGLLAQDTTLELNLNLDSGQYKILLVTNPGAGSTPFLSSQFTTLTNNNLSIISSVGSGSTYLYFYDFQIQYPECESEIDSVKMIVKNVPSPVANFDSSYNICDFPILVLDAGNDGIKYNWNTNETTKTINAIISQKYIVTITNSVGCKTIDSSSVTLKKSPIFNLGNDTVVCDNTPLILKSGFNNVGYTHVWSPKINYNTQITTDTSKVYILNLTNTQNGCFYIDTIKIENKKSPTVSLGNDTTACKTNSLSLSIMNPQPNYSYMWSNSSVGNSYLVNSTETVSVTVSENNSIVINGQNINYKCSNSDQINVVLSNIQKPNLGPDITSCEDFVTIIVPNDIKNNYYWNNYNAGNSLSVSKSGNYKLYVIDKKANCSDSDDINIVFANKAYLDLGNDAVVCTGSHSLKANDGFDTYLWTPGNFPNQEIVLNTTGEYTVVATNKCGQSTDKINITFAKPPTNFNLKDTTYFCNDTTLSIPAQSSKESVLWNNGESDYSIDIDSSGIYWVKVSNECGTISKATVAKKIERPEIAFTSQNNDMYGIFVDKSLNNEDTKWEFKDENDYEITKKGFTHKFTKEDNYNIKLSISNICYTVDTTFIFKVDKNSSINIIDKENINIYPNPFNNYLYIDSKNLDSYSISIYDINGKKVVNAELKEDNTILNLETLEKGFYIFKIENNLKNIINKILIKE